jgi:hypothetical protein
MDLKWVAEGQRKQDTLSSKFLGHIAQCKTPAIYRTPQFKLAATAQMGTLYCTSRTTLSTAVAT